jgi:hypothetical protein
VSMTLNMLVRVLAAMAFASAATPTVAASEEDFKAAYAAAEAAERQAGTLHNQWTTTEATLAAARKTAAAGNFAAAVSQAREAEALAKASIFQANDEKERWKDMEVR